KPMPAGMPGIREGQTLAVYLESKGVKLTLLYTVSDKAAVITRSMKLENNSAEPVQIDRAYSFAFSLPNEKWKALYLAGTLNAETHMQETELTRGTLRLDTNRGVSSAAMNPMLAVGKPETCELSGPAYGINLIYSGSWALEAERVPAGIGRIQGGINDFDFAWYLAPGETFQTPEAVLAYSDEGFSGLSRQFHDIYRESLIPRKHVKASRPMVINSWEGTEYNFDGEKLRRIITTMAGTGVDTFVMDDGWFRAEGNDKTSLGDWEVNEAKLGGTLQELVDFTHAQGMKFGLWVEPEMINPDSDLYRAHPDWAIKTPDEVPLLGRNQLVLDLTREEVRVHIANKLNRIIQSHGVDYVKWDYNRDISEGYSFALPPERQKEMMHRQTLGSYDLCRRIIEANPDIIFEGCASGAGRYDPGNLYYFTQYWISDQTDALARAKIQYGSSLCYPLSTMSCHVTSSPNQRAKHIVPLKTRVDISHLGANGYELDLAKLSEEEFALIPSQVAAYRADEDLVLSGDLYRLSAPYGSSNFFAVCLVSKDKKKARITSMKLQENWNEAIIRLHPAGLDAEKQYYCPELDKTMAGSSWMRFGILPGFPAGDYQTLVYHFEVKGEYE
ncbi:MAG: alpha-galactosidase, partial [Oscillospiraceae bacterium]|nr:alpha-galactosidase [Oscillospiraceae bacterium]